MQVTSLSIYRSLKTLVTSNTVKCQISFSTFQDYLYLVYMQSIQHILLYHKHSKLIFNQTPIVKNTLIVKMLQLSGFSQRYPNKAQRPVHFLLKSCNPFMPCLQKLICIIPIMSINMWCAKPVLTKKCCVAGSITCLL